MVVVTDPRKVVVSAQVARADRARLERQAAEEDRTLSAVVRRILSEYVSRLDEKDETR